MIERHFRNSEHGFTLIELLVAMVLLSVLVSLAVPSFVAYRRNSELTSIAYTMVASMNTARSEAMKRNMDAMVTPVDGDNKWSKGWHVFVDVDRDLKYSSGDLIVMTQSAPPAYITITGNGTSALATSYVLFDGSGFSKKKDRAFGANTIRISRSDIAATNFREIRRLKLSSTGRTRVCTPTSASDAACKATGADS